MHDPTGRMSHIRSYCGAKVGTGNSSMSPPRGINPVTHQTMRRHSTTELHPAPKPDAQLLWHQSPTASHQATCVNPHLQSRYNHWHVEQNQSIKTCLESIASIKLNTNTPTQLPLSTQTCSWLHYLVPHGQILWCGWDGYPVSVTLRTRNEI